MVVFDGLSSSKTELQSPQNLNMKHYKTVMFVQILKCQAPLAYKRLFGDASVATPSFSLAISLVTTVRF